MSRRSAKSTQQEHDSRIPQGKPSPTLSDEELLQRSKNGETEAFGILCIRYQPAAYRTAYAILENDADARDAVQEGFLNAFTGFKTFRGKSSFKTWLVTVVAKAALAIRRRKRSQRTIEAGIAARCRTRTIQKLIDTLVAEEELKRAEDFLRNYATDRIWLICWLRIDKGLTYPEIAQALNGETDRTVRYVMDRLFEALKDFLNQNE